MVKVAHQPVCPLPSVFSSRYGPTYWAWDSWLPEPPPPPSSLLIVTVRVNRGSLYHFHFKKGLTISLTITTRSTMFNTKFASWSHLGSQVGTDSIDTGRLHSGELKQPRSWTGLTLCTTHHQPQNRDAKGRFGAFQEGIATLRLYNGFLLYDARFISLLPNNRFFTKLSPSIMDFCRAMQDLIPSPQ